jgi:hypothetical protein
VRATRVVLAGLLTTAAIVAPLSSASARWFHHGGGGHHHGLIGGLFGFAGGVIVGAATIATAPIAIVANAASGPDRGYGPPRSYGYRGDGYDGPPQSYSDGQDRGDYSQYDRSGEDRAYGPPPGPDYGPPRYSREEDDRRFNREGPPPDDYASRGDSGYDEDDRNESSYGRPNYSRGEEERRHWDDDNAGPRDGYGRGPRGEDQGDPSDDPSD